MAKGTQYVSKQPNRYGLIEWTEEENGIWSELLQRQMNNLPGRACDEYLAGIERLALPKARVPQLDEVNEVLRDCTGWETAMVPALISFDKFFALLAEKKFPVATFIRTREEFDYLQEPDIFHEIFGHCPMLTHPDFAAFTHEYGKLGLKASKEERVFLARLYWFTVEFGLLRQNGELRIYGGGIISSPGETLAAMEGEVERKPLEVLDCLRTPYRIDIMQPVYFVIDQLSTLSDIAQMDLMAMVEKAKAMGLHAPLFPPKEEKKAS